MQADDMPVIYADANALELGFGFVSKIMLKVWLKKFEERYKWYYQQ